MSNSTPRMTQQDAWTQLTGLETTLTSFTPIPAPTTGPAYWLLECELSQRAVLTASRVAVAVKCMPDRSKAERWLGALLGCRDNNTGAIYEMFGYGIFSERKLSFNAPHVITAGELYRSGDPQNGIDLDGILNNHGILFDIKSLGNPGGVFGRLLEDLNVSVAPDGYFTYEGSMDFDHTILGQNYASVKRNLLAAVSSGTPCAPLTGVPLKLRLKSRTVGVNIVGETSVNAYRFAQENAHMVLTHASQVPRSKRFVFVYVYSRESSAVAYDPEVAERALARRMFMQLSKDTRPVTAFCDNADPAAKVKDVVASIGGVCFINVAEPDNPSIGMYLNPNAKPSQKIEYDTQEWSDNFEPDTFERFDNYQFDNY